jgi:hypothetical protein
VKVKDRNGVRACRDGAAAQAGKPFPTSRVNRIILKSEIEDHDDGATAKSE